MKVSGARRSDSLLPALLVPSTAGASSNRPDPSLSRRCLINAHVCNTEPSDARSEQGYRVRLLREAQREDGNPWPFCAHRMFAVWVLWRPMLPATGAGTLDYDRKIRSAASYSSTNSKKYTIPHPNLSHRTEKACGVPITRGPTPCSRPARLATAQPTLLAAVAYNAALNTSYSVTECELGHTPAHQGSICTCLLACQAGQPTTTNLWQCAPPTSCPPPIHASTHTHIQHTDVTTKSQHCTQHHSPQTTATAAACNPQKFSCALMALTELHSPCCS